MPGMLSLEERLGLDKKVSMISVNSERWEVLSDSGASLISPVRRTNEGSVRSWKSAGNGETMSEFGSKSARSIMVFRDELIVSYR